MVRAHPTVFLFMAVASYGQVGRFSSALPVRLTSFEVSANGFHMRNDSSKTMFSFPSNGRVRFSQPADWVSKTVLASDLPGGPQKLNLRLNIPGFGALFGEQMRITIHGTAIGYITWPEGTVGVGVPAAPTAPWYLLSFAPAGPIVAIAFLNHPSEIKLEKDASGDLELVATRPGGIGWVRFLTPFGNATKGATTAAEFGKISTDAKPLLDRLAQWQPNPKPTPKIIVHLGIGAVSIIEPASDGLSILPPAVALAASKVLAKVWSGDKQFQAPTAEGPLIFYRGSLEYAMPIPRTAPIIPADLSLAAGLRLSVPDGSSENALLTRYVLRSYLSEKEYEELAGQLAASAAHLLDAASWQTWIEPNSGLRLQRLMDGDENVVERHARAACVLCAAAQMRPDLMTPALRDAIRRCISVVMAFMDWAILAPRYNDADLSADALGMCLMATEMAAQIEWRDDPWDGELATTAARLALHANLRFAFGPYTKEAIIANGLAAPCLLTTVWQGGRVRSAIHLLGPAGNETLADLDGRGKDTSVTVRAWVAAQKSPVALRPVVQDRIERCEFDSRDPREFRAAMTPGPGFVFQFGAKKPVTKVAIDGKRLKPKKGKSGDWSVWVPALAESQILTIYLQTGS